MALNIKAKRLMSLEEFATGWEDCYLKLRVVKHEEAEVIQAKMNLAEKVGDAEAMSDIVLDVARSVVIGGVVMNTDDNGQASKYEFSEDEAAEVVEALGDTWCISVIQCATGADRLKSLRS